MARLLLVDRVCETRGFINASGPAVPLLHFQCQFATIHLPRFSLNGLQEFPSDAISAMLGQNPKIVDVDEWAGSECREAPETNSDPDRVFALPSQKYQGSWMLSQAAQKLAPGLVGQWLPVSHRVH